MKFIYWTRCLPNKHIYFINGSFTSFLIHLFLELGIDLFRCKNSLSTTSFRGVVLSTHWCKHRQNFNPSFWFIICLLPPHGFLRQETTCNVAKWTPGRRGWGLREAKLKVSDSQVSAEVRNKDYLLGIFPTPRWSPFNYRKEELDQAAGHLSAVKFALFCVPTAAMP